MDMFSFMPPSALPGLCQSLLADRSPCFGPQYLGGGRDEVQGNAIWRTSRMDIQSRSPAEECCRGTLVRRRRRSGLSLLGVSNGNPASSELSFHATVRSRDLTRRRKTRAFWPL